MLNGISLFLGVESQFWQISQFQAAAQAAKALGVSTLLIKVADGTYEWYGAIGGWPEVLAVVEDVGIRAVPYTYMYGNKYGGLLSEIAILKEIMGITRIVVADMEAEWNGQITWANVVARSLQDTPGQFGVTTWADPYLQNWQGVINALKPCVDFWMPQVYNDFLASVYRTQFAELPVVPTFNLGSDMGPNNLTAMVKAVLGQPVAFWEYQAAIADYQTIMKDIATMFPTNQGGTDMLQITDSFAATHFTETTPTTWHCTKTGIDIHDEILDYWRKTGGMSRLPRTPEIYGVIDGGSFQVFEAGVLVYDPKHSLDDPGFGNVYAMHLDKDTPGLRKLMDFAGMAMPTPSPSTQTVIDALTAADAAILNALHAIEPAKVA